MMINTGNVADTKIPTHLNNTKAATDVAPYKLKKYIAPPTTETLYIARKKCLT